MDRHLSYRSLSALMPWALGISLVACGANAGDEAVSGNALAGASGSVPSVSAQDYKNGASTHPGVVDASTMQEALTALTGNIDVAVDGFKHGVTAGHGSGATQKADVACMAGGVTNVAGYMNMAPSPAAIDVNLSIAFRSCMTSTGTMVDGNVDFSQTLASREPDTTRRFEVETIYEGDVNLSGNINVSCPVDLNVLVDDTGRALKVQGMFCNQDAGDLAMQLRPLWRDAASSVRGS